jgi:hypothetical protein
VLTPGTVYLDTRSMVFACSDQRCLHVALAHLSLAKCFCCLLGWFTGVLSWLYSWSHYLNVCLVCFGLVYVGMVQSRLFSW